MSSSTDIKALAARWNLPAAFAAWLLPGLGHFLLGQRGRGILLSISIGTLWLIGLFIGGISIVDRNNHPAWFLGQMLLAPSLAADWYHHDLIDQQIVEGQGVAPGPDNDPLFEPAYGRAKEQGTLFTSLAGLLNLLAMIDVIYRDPKDNPTPQTDSAAPDS